MRLDGDSLVDAVAHVFECYRLAAALANGFRQSVARMNGKIVDPDQQVAFFRPAASAGYRG